MITSSLWAHLMCPMIAPRLQLAPSLNRANILYSICDAKMLSKVCIRISDSGRSNLLREHLNFFKAKVLMRTGDSHVASIGCRDRNIKHLRSIQRVSRINDGARVYERM